MTTKLLVCQNSACNAQGSASLMRDIEELASGGCEVQECGCLGKCGKGPNVELTLEGNPVIHQGINTWKKALQVVEDLALVDVDSKVAKFGQLKYDVRRIKDDNVRLAEIEKLFKTLGGEAKATKTSPELLADLFLMRSIELAKRKAPQAVSDAKKATELVPTRAFAFVTLSGAYDAAHFPTQARDSMRTALELGNGINKALLKRQLKKLELKAKEEEDDPEKFKKLQEADVGKVAKPAASASVPNSRIHVLFGGRKGFERLAHEVHEMMFVHPATKDFFPPTMDNSRITKRNVDFLHGAFGGPKYVGPDMVAVHEFLRITNQQYDVMIDCYEKALAAMQATDVCTEAILRQLEGMRFAIVYRKDRPNPNARANPKFLQLHMTGGRQSAKEGDGDVNPGASKTAPKAKTRAKSKPKRRSIDTPTRNTKDPPSNENAGFKEGTHLQQAKPATGQDDKLYVSDEHPGTAHSCPYLALLSIPPGTVLVNPHGDNTGVNSLEYELVEGPPQQPPISKKNEFFGLRGLIL